MKKKKAFSPGGISSIFEIIDHEIDGTPISDPLKIGARGGGFVISSGIETMITAERDNKDHVTVYINGLNQDAITTDTVVRNILRMTGDHMNVSVHHSTELPIGCGYGTSAAGSLSAALALSQALDLDITYDRIGQIAHQAEIECETGLGTVGPLMIGGLVITKRAGGPGYSLIDRIPVDQSYRIVTGYFGPISTKSVLSNQTRKVLINQYGKDCVEEIINKPTPTDFLNMCKIFADKSGFMTERVHRMIEAMERSGAIGATQNMLGEAVHALVEFNKEKRVFEAARRFLPKESIISTTIDFEGAKIIEI